MYTLISRAPQLFMWAAAGLMKVIQTFFPCYGWVVSRYWQLQNLWSAISQAYIMRWATIMGSGSSAVERWAGDHEHLRSNPGHFAYELIGSSKTNPHCEKKLVVLHAMPKLGQTIIRDAFFTSDCVGCAGCSPPNCLLKCSSQPDSSFFFMGVCLPSH